MFLYFLGTLIPKKINNVLVLAYLMQFYLTLMFLFSRKFEILYSFLHEAFPCFFIFVHFYFELHNYFIDIVMNTVSFIAVMGIFL